MTIPQRAIAAITAAHAEHAQQDSLCMRCYPPPPCDHRNMACRYCGWRRPGGACAWRYDDGGRAAAGFKGEAGDCVTRAIAIATGRPYRQVYDELGALVRGTHTNRGRRRASARDGMPHWAYERYLRSIGWTWIPTMRIGSGTKVHLRADELPAGRLVVRLSKHMAAVIDGVVHDTFDPSRGGTRAVYGYWLHE